MASCNCGQHPHVDWCVCWGAPSSRSNPLAGVPCTNQNHALDGSVRDEFGNCDKCFPVVRTFDTGATRDTDQHKLSYEGFLSPLVLRRYAEYMDKHRVQKDGTLRSADNWQKGIPLDVYADSEWRHHMEFWSLHRGYGDGDIQEAICATLFNLMGYLHVVLEEQDD